MPSRTKPIQLIKAEGNKRHLSKAEMALREKAESALMTGQKLRESDEVRNNPVAHKEFNRLIKLLKAIGKNDDLTGNIINTHCILHAEILDLVEKRERMSEAAKLIEDKFSELSNVTIEEIKSTTEGLAQIYATMMKCDSTLMSKRKMLLDIAKDNILTINSALRSIPKKEEKKTESPMAAFIKRKSEGNA